MEPHGPRGSGPCDRPNQSSLFRGTPLERATCTGIGMRRGSTYRRFSCVGVVVPKGIPDWPVRVRYVLNPRGEHKGHRSAYLATSVHFDAFGVP